jgi:hypothetical protein
MSGLSSEVCKIQVGLVFKTPSELFDAVEQAFLSTGMPASHFIRKPKGSFNDEEQLQHFGSIFRRNGEVVPCPVRGAFRCKKTGKQGGCPRYVQFGHYIKHSGYLITVSCTEHNHPVSEPTIDGYTEIKYEKDLEIDELEVIRSLSSVNTRIPKMQYSLRTTFPTRMRLYDSQLLHRVSNKYQDDKYSQDRHRMSLFMEMGNNVKDGGGKFKTDVNST